MFVKINKNAIVNTDHIVWVDTNDEGNPIVKLSDGTEHASTSDKLETVMSIINNGAKMASCAK